MTQDEVIPAHIRDFLLYSWDAPHACGVTSRRQHAIGEAREAVSRAEIGTVAVVKRGLLTGGLPDRVVGYAEHRDTGVVWTATEMQPLACRSALPGLPGRNP